MVIIFLNSNTNLNSKERAHVIKYCEEKLTRYESEFINFNDTSSRETLSILEQKGKKWLKKSTLYQEALLAAKSTTTA